MKWLAGLQIEGVFYASKMPKTHWTDTKKKYKKNWG
jgi:hypothetical protein